MTHRLLRSGLVLLLAAVVAAGSAAAGIAFAQDDDEQNDGDDRRRVVDAHGVGTTRGPAETAELQVVIGSGYYGKPVPGTFEEPLDPEMLQPVIDRLIDIGIPEGDIQQASLAGQYLGPPGSTQLMVRLDAPTHERIQETLEAVTDAASSNRLELYNVGVRYGTSGCEELVNQARLAALDDARERATPLAALLDGTIGEIVYVGDIPLPQPGIMSEMPMIGSACGTTLAAAYPMPYPPYDPAQPIEVTVVSHLNVTYAVE